MPFMASTEKNKTEFQEQLLAVLDSMYNLGYRLTRNHEEANDLVQEASLRAYRFYGKFEQGTNFKAWILTILRNLFINQYRKNVKEPRKSSYEEMENMIGSVDLSGVEEEVFGEHVQLAINELSEELRTAVTLFYVDEFSYKEIARIMKCPIGTVMSRLHMARQLLKKRLSRHLKNEGIH